MSNITLKQVFSYLNEEAETFRNAGGRDAKLHWLQHRLYDPKTLTIRSEMSFEYSFKNKKIALNIMPTYQGSIKNKSYTMLEVNRNMFLAEKDIHQNSLRNWKEETKYIFIIFEGNNKIPYKDLFLSDQDKNVTMNKKAPYKHFHYSYNNIYERGGEYSALYASDGKAIEKKKNFELSQLPDMLHLKNDKFTFHRVSTQFTDKKDLRESSEIYDAKVTLMCIPKSKLDQHLKNGLKTYALPAKAPNWVD